MSRQPTAWREHVHGPVQPMTDDEFTLAGYLKGVGACLLLALVGWGFVIMIGGN